ncbi:MAG TPA: DUF4199 domain-containing protein, partial [Opitutaceae bacterium]|nr:DUF4199 domain-containing protein [Opitutaceae bacterium]
MKIPLLYGIGITFVMSAITLVTHLMGYWTNPEKFMTGAVINMIAWFIVFTMGIILGTRRVRAERGAAEFTYGQAYMSGLMVAVFSGLAGVIFNFIFFKFLVPEFAETQA